MEKNILSIGEGKMTTVKLSSETKARLDHLRVHRRETYEEILEKMLDILNACRLAPERAHAHLVLIDKQRKNNVKLKQEAH